MRREDPVESERERQAGDPPDTWQEHWFDHRQLLKLYDSDDHCAIYLDPDVRRAEVRWLPRYISAAWHYSKATYGDAFGPDPRIYSIHHAGRHGGGHALAMTSALSTITTMSATAALTPGGRAKPSRASCPLMR